MEAYYGIRHSVWQQWDFGSSEKIEDSAVLPVLFKLRFKFSKNSFFRNGGSLFGAIRFKIECFRTSEKHQNVYGPDF